MARPTNYPTDLQTQAAVDAFWDVVVGGRLPFKVGRVAAIDWDGLPSAERYLDASHFVPLVIAPRHKIEVLEKIVITMAWRFFPRRCRNRQAGSGGVSAHPDHFLYVAFYPRDSVSSHDDYIVLT